MRDSILLLAAVLIAFGLTLGGSFHFDDFNLFGDPAITSSSGWWEVWRPLQTRPLTFFTFWMSFQIGGRNPIGYHAVNLALHAAAVLLLRSVLGRLLPSNVALLAAALFAVHPIQTEAVAYVFARSTLLATVLSLAAFREWIIGRHWRALLWFAAALLAKEECAAFPLFLLLLNISMSRDRREWRPIAAMTALSAIAGARLLWAAAVTPGSGFAAGSGISPIDYASVQGIAILRYFRMLIVPWGFTVDVQLARPAPWIAILAWLVILASAVAALRWLKHLGPGLWYLGGLILLLPSSSILPVADLAVDRRMYLPMTAFAILPAMALTKMRWRTVPIAVIAILTAFSVRYSSVWKTERSLWTEAAGRAPEKLRPKLQLAETFDPPDALRVLDEAERIAPNDPVIATARGRIYLSTGHAPQALMEFGKALAMAPNDPMALNNRGAALMMLGQTEAARSDFEKALARDPCLFGARLNLRQMGAPIPPDPGCRFTSEQRAQLGEPH